MKAKQNTRKLSKKVVVLLALLIPLIIIAGFVVRQQWHNYQDISNRAGIVEIRALILQGLRGVKKDAPVDPRTGDVYFPESHLYLPRPETPLTITYLYDNSDVANAQSELSVSTYPVRGTEKLYMAHDMTTLFDEVPHVQACSRGIKVVHNKYPASDTANVLHDTVQLQSGKSVYIYLERDCPELGDLADELQNLQSY